MNLLKAQFLLVEENFDLTSLMTDAQLGDGSWDLNSCPFQQNNEVPFLYFSLSIQKGGFPNMEKS